MIRKPVRIDRYLLREAGAASLLSVGFYTFVMVMNQVFILVRDAFEHGWPASLVLEILLMWVPKILVLTLPMGLLLGVLIGIGRLSANSEIVALMSAGVSYHRMLRPVLLLGFAGFLVSAGIYHLVVPWCFHRMEVLRLEVVRRADPNREIRPRLFYSGIPGAILYAQDIDPQDSDWPLHRVFLYLEKGEQGRETFVCGARGRVEHEPAAARIVLMVEKGEIHTIDPDKPEAYDRIPFAGPFRQVITYGDGVLRGKESHKGSREETLSELNADLSRLSSSPAWESNPVKLAIYRNVLSEMHIRFAWPVACIGFCLLAFPLALTGQRGGKASGFAVSLPFIIAHWVATMTGHDLGLAGKVPVWLGIWAPEIVLIGAGAALFLLKQRFEGFRLPGIFTGLFGKLSRRQIFAPRPEPVAGAASQRPRLLRLGTTAIMDRYLAKRFLAAFTLVLASVLTLYSVIEIKNLLDSLLERQLPLTIALQYLFYLVPGMLKVLLPITSAVAAVVTLSTFCASHEDTALKAAGISIFRLSAPLFLVTLLICAAYFVIQDYVTPYTNHKAAAIQDFIEGRASSTSESGTRWVFGKDTRLYGYSDYDARARAVENITAIDLDPKSFEVQRRLWASQVQWKSGVWIAQRGWQRDFDAQGEKDYRVLEDTPVRLRETPEDFDRQERSLLGSGRLAEEMSFVALRQHIRRIRFSGFDTDHLRVALYEKLAFPVAPLVMVLIGVPFALRTGRRGSLYGLGIALVLVIAYWACFAISNALGQEGILPPLLSAFSPNILFALTGGYFFLSTRS